MPPTGSSWIARRWHLYPQLHAARGPSSWRRNRSPVTVPRASGENPGQDDPDAAGVLDLDSGPEMGTSPGSSNGPEPGRRPCPGTPWRSRPPRPRPPGRRRIRLPGASILYLGITLSDERGEGERAHCRRSGRVGGLVVRDRAHSYQVDPSLSGTPGRCPSPAGSGSVEVTVRR
jgi:hypothetical protein